MADQPEWFPMPGTELYETKVIASVYVSDNVAMVIVLYQNPPYYGVGYLEHESGKTRYMHVESFHNILEATRFYSENGGDI